MGKVVNIQKYYKKSKLSNLAMKREWRHHSLEVQRLTPNIKLIENGLKNWLSKEVMQ
jgi:hypothetical protein